MRRRTQFFFTVVAAAAIGAITLGALAWEAGTQYISPAPSIVGPPPGDLHAETVVIPSTSGSLLHGWFIQGPPGPGTCPGTNPAVALFRGVGGNRLHMIARARLLHQAGYSVLLVDFQAEGESPGRQITFGYLEGKDVEATLAYLHKRLPGARLGAIGVSLGGASLALAQHPLPLDAVVLESCYSTIDAAVADRLAIQLGKIGPDLAPLLTGQLWPRLGIAPAKLRPLDHLADFGCPVLIAAGAMDQHTLLSETQAMFAAARGPKELWVVPGAAHVDLLRASPAAYREHVVTFLAHHLKSPVNGRD